MNIYDIARSADVTRWHSVSCYRYPSIAEHSFLVTMYASALANIIYPSIATDEKLALLQFCLWHDMPETLTGDLATPLKRRLEASFPEGDSPLEQIEESLCPEYKAFKDNLKDELKRIAKLADIMEAMKFISSEGKGGVSQHIFYERQKTFKELVKDSSKKYPYLNWQAADTLLQELLNGTPTMIDFVDAFR
ncbi:MAG: HD domain-containing protein [Endozoicomonadaceae bacterium]|nr:HD domain-containing protein [Endozoicomonadaceae bacterium]